MASSFPTSLDTFTNPSSTDALDSVSVPHATQHSDLNDAVEALQAKVGVDSSAVTSSLDYKVAALEAISHGKILQIVRATDSTLRTITATSWVDVTNLSVAITPTSATSIILVIGSVQCFVQDTAGPTGVLKVRLYDGTSALSGAETAQLRITGGAGPGYEALITMIGYDAPATTSTLTYKIQAEQASSTSAQIKNDINTGQIYAIEVAA